MSVLIYKDDIIEKIGGKSQFGYVVMSFCESIRDDASLNPFFAHLDLDGLMELQQEFLDAAFLVASQKEMEATLGRLTVQHQLLWKMGMNETHFEQLKVHFMMALEECWADDELKQACEKHFNGLRPLFQQNSSKFFETRPKIKSYRSFHRTEASALQRT